MRGLPVKRNEVVRRKGHAVSGFYPDAAGGLTSGHACGDDIDTDAELELLKAYALVGENLASRGDISGSHELLQQLLKRYPGLGDVLDPDTRAIWGR